MNTLNQSNSYHSNFNITFKACPSEGYTPLELSISDPTILDNDLEYSDPELMVSWGRNKILSTVNKNLFLNFFYTVGAV